MTAHHQTQASSASTAAAGLQKGQAVGLEAGRSPDQVGRVVGQVSWRGGGRARGTRLQCHQSASTRRSRPPGTAPTGVASSSGRWTAQRGAWWPARGGVSLHAGCCRGGHGDGCRRCCRSPLAREARTGLGAPRRRPASPAPASQTRPRATPPCKSGSLPPTPAPTQETRRP